MKEKILFVFVLALGLTTEVAKADFTFGDVEPLPEPINTPGISAADFTMTADGLEAYFVNRDRPGGYGGIDIWVSQRESKEDGWGPVVNLGPLVNTSSTDGTPNISSDGLELYFSNVGPSGFSYRPGGHGGGDIWVTQRANRDDEWAVPVNLGPKINTRNYDIAPSLSTDGSTLYFAQNDISGWGGTWMIYESVISPVVDFNGDKVVDCTDLCEMVDHWGTDEPLCDIGPMPWGDGIVDVQDLIVLADHLFEEVPPVE